MTFQYPAAWRERDALFDERQTSWQAVIGPADGYVEVLAFDVEGDLSASELEAFATRFFAFVENEALGDRRDGPVRATTVAGVRAFEATFSRDEGAAKRAVVFADASTAYAVDCYIPPNAYAVETGCETVLSTFSLSA